MRLTRGPLSVLAEPNFRRFFVGHAVSLLGDGMVGVALSFAVLDLTRSPADLGDVLAARSLGASDARIITRHLLPNILQPIMVQATIAIAGAILAESTLSFLGLGVLAPLPSWGAMLNDGRSHLFDAPHLVIFPALAVMSAVLAFNLLGDALRDWMDPRMRAYLIVTDLSR